MLGLGYFYAGRTNDGIIRLISWIIYDLIAGITISLLLAVFIGLVCIPFQLVIQIGIPFWSATSLKNQLLSQPTVVTQVVQPMISGPVAEPAIMSQATQQDLSTDSETSQSLSAEESSKEPTADE